MKKESIVVPEGCKEVLLHACCAPCSSAIVEWMLVHDVRPTIFYYNPNIFPLEEYEIRKNESKRHAASLGIRWIDGDYDHETWLHSVCGLEGEPERGRRCEQCFTLRLTHTAKVAKQLGIRYLPPRWPPPVGKASTRSTVPASSPNKWSMVNVQCSMVSPSGPRTGARAGFRNDGISC